MVLKVTRGYSPDYLLKEVAAGRENYYTGAVAAGEPPGRWWGSGAEVLGLSGLVDAQDMRAVYERFLDPREDGFNDPSKWDEVYTLGHAGRRYLSEDELYNAAVEHEPNADAERRQELRVEAGRNARHNVAFFDLTYNVQKSITVLHAAFEAQAVAARRAGDTEKAQAWDRFRETVEEAIWAGNNAMLAYLQQDAGYSRIDHHGGGAGRWIDAHDWVVGSFFQHDSREHDPHLHIHNAALNRVRGEDGVWRTIDGRLLYRWKRAAAAVAERVTAEHLTHALGVPVAMRPDGKAREVVGISTEAMELLSTRRRQVTEKTAELVSAFETRHGRGPTSLELNRLAQQATLLTRRAKSHTGETREEMLDRVDATLRGDLDSTLGDIARAVLEARPQDLTVEAWSPQAVLEMALEQVKQAKASWTAADLTAQIDAALPDTLGMTDGADIARLLRTLTDEGLRQATGLHAPRPGDALLPADRRLANGASSYESPGGARYATPDQVRTERALVAATAAGGATALPAATARRYLTQLRESGIELGVDQAAAVYGVLTSGARIECLVGPAGTGKSFVVGVVAHAWTDPTLVPAVPEAGGPDGAAAPVTVAARRMFGLATSQVATQVLAAEGLAARNVTRWLATQARLATGPGAGWPRPVQGDEAWRLRAGDLVVVDESAMTDNAAIAAIHSYVDAVQAKMLLAGDHRQLATIGAGGAMALLAGAGTRYELTEARRFTHPWERDASLRLREGDDTVLDTYHRHGRLLDSGTRDQAEASAARGWLADTLAGKQSVLIVDDNTAAARLSGLLRAELVALGRVAEHGVPLAQGCVAGVGDLVQARWNGWDLAGVEGNRRGPINRETYRVTHMRDDGALEVRLSTGGSDGVGPGGEPVGQRMVLPADYVAEHLALAYASTVHAAQGRTTDNSHAVVAAWTSLAALYVSLSRGRDANTAHVATTSTVEDPAQGRPDQVVHRNPLSLLAGILTDRDQPEHQSATASAAQAAARVENLQTAGDMFAAAAADAVTARTAVWLDQLTDSGYLTTAQRTRMAAEDAAPTLGRVLRRVELAGADARQILLDTITDRPLDGATNLTNVLCSRITNGDTRRIDPVGEAWAGWVPATGRTDWDAWLGELARAADTRTAELGRAAAVDPPAWALDALGPVPDIGEAGSPDIAAARGDWERRAGIVAGYRELRGHTDPVEALDRPPAPHRQAEAYASYRAAWTALGRPEAQQEDHERSNGYHHARIRAWEREQRWGVRYVGNELAGTRQAAGHHRQTATLRRAETLHADNPDTRARLAREARDADALAATLDHRVTELEEIDAAHLRWRLHSARTHGEADISRHVLAGRDVDNEPQITADDWLAAHAEATTVDERHRPILEEDILDADLDRERAERPPTSPDLTADDAAPPDIRDTAHVEPGRARREDQVRVTTADESADGIASARRAIREIEAREAWEHQAEQDEHDAQLARWHNDEHHHHHDDHGRVDTAEDSTWSDDADLDEPVLTRE